MLKPCWRIGRTRQAPKASAVALQSNFVDNLRGFRSQNKLKKAQRWSRSSWSGYSYNPCLSTFPRLADAPLIGDIWSTWEISNISIAMLLLC